MSHDSNMSSWVNSYCHNMNFILFLIALVKLIDSREIYTVYYSERHNLEGNGLSDVFKNEGAIVWSDIKLILLLD